MADFGKEIRARTRSLTGGSTLERRGSQLRRLIDHFSEEYSVVEDNRVDQCSQRLVCSRRRWVALAHRFSIPSKRLPTSGKSRATSRIVGKLYGGLNGVVSEAVSGWRVNHPQSLSRDFPMRSRTICRASQRYFNPWSAPLETSLPHKTRQVEALR